MKPTTGSYSGSSYFMAPRVINWLLENAQLVVSFSFLIAAALSVPASAALIKDAKHHRDNDPLSRRHSLDYLLLVCLPGGMVAGFLSSTTVYLLELRYEHSLFIGPLLFLGCSIIGLVFIAILAYVVRIKLRTDAYSEESTVKRAGISWSLRHANAIVLLTAVIAVVCAYKVPSPDLRTDLSAWGWAFRTAICVPGLFYTSAAAVIFARGAANTPRASAKNRRWRHATLGSMGFALLWINLWAWPLISLHPEIGWAATHAPGLERILEAPIFAFFGLAYARAFLPRYRTGSVDQLIAASMEAQSVSDNICAQLFGRHGVKLDIMDNALERLNILSRVGTKISLDPMEQRLARYALLIYAGYRRGVVSQEEIRHLDDLTREQISAGTEPGTLPRAVGPVLKLLDPSQSGQHFLSPGSRYEAWTLVFLVFACEYFDDLEANKQLAHNRSHAVDLIRCYKSISARELYGY